MDQDHYSPGDSDEASDSSKKSSRGNFFTVDRWTWGKLCDVGSINEAAAYLVLAQGTIKDNRSTRWSATSLKTYAGISWNRATDAIDGLISKRFLRTAESSTKAKPRYELLSPAEIGAAEFVAKEADLSAKEQIALEQLRSESRAKRTDWDSLYSLQKRGLALSIGGTWQAIKPKEAPEPEPIWLPNSLVTGSDAGEESPVSRLRRGGDIWTLRLLVDLYHAHNLRDDGGINPNTLREEYTRMRVGERGYYIVWGFKATHCSGSWDSCLKPHQNRKHEPKTDHPLWESVGNLRREGLLTFVPHLWDHYDADTKAVGEIIHSCASFSGEPMEIELGQAANRAALAMIPEFKREKAEAEGYYRFAPVRNTIPNVCMIGVGRLRYRARTSRTGEWYSTLTREGPAWLKQYRELELSGGNFHSAIA